MEKFKKFVTSWKIGLIAVIIFVPLLLYFLTCYVYPLIFSELSQASEKFSAISALFSGLAFGLLFMAILIQRNEIKLQSEAIKSQKEQLELYRSEINTNFKEMENQTSQFKEQNKNMELQKFENTFFNMLAMADRYYTTSTIGGIDPIKELYHQIKNNYNSITEHKKFDPNDNKSTYEFPKKINVLYYQSSLKYFRIIIEIMRFLKRGEYNDNIKRTYFDILTVNILYPGLFFFEGLKPENVDIKCLIEKFNMFRVLDDNYFEIINNSITNGNGIRFKNLYHPLAYNQQD